MQAEYASRTYRGLVHAYRSYITYSMPAGSDAGGFTVTGQTGGPSPQLYGTVDATMVTNPELGGRTVRARGSWRCFHAVWADGKAWR